MGLRFELVEVQNQARLGQQWLDIVLRKHALDPKIFASRFGRSEMRGQHNDRDVRHGVVHDPRCFDAIHHRHRVVHDDQIRLVLGNALERFVAVRSLDTLHPQSRPQIKNERLTHNRMVVNDQDPAHEQNFTGRYHYLLSGETSRPCKVLKT